MDINTLQNTWNAYQSAWADVSLAQREQLLTDSVVEDCQFNNPTAEGHGRNNLLTHIGVFQTQFPGAYFRSNKLLAHHGQFLSEWTMFNKDGSEFLTGHSVVRYNDEGKITHLAGYWVA